MNSLNVEREEEKRGARIGGGGNDNGGYLHSLNKENVFICMCLLYVHICLCLPVSASPGFQGIRLCSH